MAGVNVSMASVNASMASVNASMASVLSMLSLVPAAGWGQWAYTALESITVGRFEAWTTSPWGIVVLSSIGLLMTLFAAVAVRFILETAWIVCAPVRVLVRLLVRV